MPPRRGCWPESGWQPARTELVGIVRREIKEAVAAIVSRLNQCPYCVDAHTMMLHAVSAHGAAAAISQGLDETPLPSNRGWLKGTLKRMAGWYFSRAARRRKPAGTSLALLPEAEFPTDMGWAASSPTVAGAFARWAAVVEIAGQEALPADVLLLVRTHIDAWNGEPPSLSRGWVDAAIAGLDDAEKPAARLTLLTALASYQVDEGIINTFRAQQPGDDKLIAATAWASFTAARRVGTWLSPQTPT